VGTAAATTAATVEAAGSVESLLAGLAVKGRAPKTGYSRDQFGAAWADVDRNGCDTRNDILNRDLTERSWRAGTGDCVVETGVLADPYTGHTIAFSKADATAVQIDHVIALSDAWQTGAQFWSAATRLVFANDPLNLLAVDGRANEQKSDSDAASWLPANEGFRCAYVARQVSVKASYGLWVTAAEHDAIAAILAGCPNQPAATTRPGPVTSSGGEVHYANCAAVRAAGKAPLPDSPHLRMSVNLSARQLSEPKLIDDIATALNAHDTEPTSLILEVTESVVMGGLDLLSTLNAIHDLGVALHVDDFGTGYSSLAYLKTLPVNALKIDRAFVDGLGTDTDDQAIVTAVIALARALSFGVIAEGVETEAQARVLGELHCDHAQGYLFARPMPSDELVAWLPEHSPAAAPATFARHPQ
jgi:EAL domain-containing protein (putative c-di-GMP-specific phosphodiesterase class I)